MELAQEYIHHGRGYRFGSRCCWIRLYAGKPADAPVVVCEEMPELGVDVSEAAGYLAAEVIAMHFPSGLPELPRPLLWIEHRWGRRRRGPSRYYLLTFPTYRPRLATMGFTRSVTLGSPRREKLSPKEVSLLIE